MRWPRSIWRSPERRILIGSPLDRVETPITGYAVARRHFEAALDEAREKGFDPDAIARYFLDLVVSKYLEKRSVSDVRSELQFIADNCDPDTDYPFSRP